MFRFTLLLFPRTSFLSFLFFFSLPSLPSLLLWVYFRFRFFFSFSHARSCYFPSFFLFTSFFFVYLCNLRCVCEDVSLSVDFLSPSFLFFSFFLFCYTVVSFFFPFFRLFCCSFFAFCVLFFIFSCFYVVRHMTVAVGRTLKKRKTYRQ
ncbi:hypothetical protein TbgDal_IX2160 [Trypanosoma brucei gambiense DAL972]|uniref:Uncharacterized protein n=1 Tax=Trypanosoma brucei gambiense (strain MHOM/CI/86/DAL972) TaxID=679716 RepID=C9ZXJ7_TRYB9|nr:hypothetical protein TbgDal_IX2160 [Trypanosoma brucei gambiense DAL972]CBH14141.1 hypothetical protein TbgDal_IX2160 [Trypanosoma brucei gambiense DAL972]|eukprot:XP_011776412.1 hypothetical protein TbgDal_IX2160 [Trypanosoma brucei gambiense DAL972]